MTSVFVPTRRSRLGLVLLCILALLALAGCSGANGETVNPLTDAGARQTAYDTVSGLTFWLWLVVAAAIALFVGSFVSQTWLPEWFQSHRMSIRVGALVVGVGVAAFNWALGQAKDSMSIGGGLILEPLAAHLATLLHLVPHLRLPGIS
jgi:hypothetical protein